MTILQLALIQLVIFVLLVIGLRKLLYSKASAEINRAKLMVDESNKRVETIRGQIEEAKTEYKQTIAKGKEDARKLIAEAQKEAEELRAKSIQETRRETEKMIKSAQAQKESMERDILSTAARKSIHFSKAILNQALTTDCLAAIHKAMIAEISNQIAAIDLGPMHEAITEAEVATVFPLEKGIKEMLQQKLSGKLKTDLQLAEKIDASLVAGISIKLGSFILDGSLANRLRIATDQLEKEHSA